MADDQHYDVVIIGTGAGGGTLGHRLATSGAEGALARTWARSCHASATTGRPRRCSSAESTSPRRSGTTDTAASSSPRSTTTSAGTPSSTARPCSGCGRRTSASSATTVASRPAWPISYDDLEPYYTQAEHLYLVHGQHGEDPSEGHASAQYAFPPVSHEPRIQQLSDDLEKLGLHPFHLPIGVNLQEAEPGRRRPGERVHPLRPGRRLPLPARRQVGRTGHLCRSGPVPGQRHPGDGRPRAAPRDGRLRAHGHGGRHDPGRRVRDHLHRRHRGRRLRRGELGRPAAEVSQRPPPRRAGQQLGSGRPALHAAQQHRPDGRLAGAQPHPVPEDAGA